VHLHTGGEEISARVLKAHVINDRYCRSTVQQGPAALVRRLVVAIMAFPLARWTLARHFPGSPSKARTTNCLYSTAENFRLPMISVPATAAVQRDAQDDYGRYQHYGNSHHHDASVCDTPHAGHTKVYSSGNPPNRGVLRASFMG